MVSSSIRFSRTLGVVDAVAFAAPIAMTVIVLGVAPLILAAAGPRAPLVLGTAAPMLLVLWFTLLERTSVAPEGEGLYSVTLAEGRRAWIPYVIGQFSLLGYLAVAILVIDVMVSDMTITLERFFEIEAHSVWCILLLVSLAGIRVLTGGAAWTRRRTVIAWVALLVPVVVLILGFTSAVPAEPVALSFPTLRNWWEPLALLGSALWALQPVLSRRRELKTPGRTTSITSVVVALGCLTVAVMGVMLALRNPTLGIDGWIYRADLRGDRLNVGLVLSVVFLAWIALVRLATAAAVLSERMIEDGFLPNELRLGRQEGPVLGALLGFQTAAAVGAMASVPRAVVAGVAAMAFFATLALAMPSWIRTSAKELPARRMPRLPLHPMFPILAVALSLLLTLVLPRWSLVVGVIWILFTFVYWRLHGGAKSTEALHEAMVVASEAPETDRDHQTLVVVLDDDALGPLLRVALPLAEHHDGDVLVLRVIDQGASSFPHVLHTRADRAHRRLCEACSALVDDQEQRIRPVVRIAPDETSGILATTAELEAELVLLPWLDQDDSETVIERVLKGTDRPVAVLRGELDERPETLTVAVGGGPQAAFGLRLASELSPEGDLELLTVVAATVPPSKGEEIMAATARAAESSRSEPAQGKERARVQRAISSPSVVDGVVETSRDRDLLVVGLAMDRLLGRSSLGGVSTEIASQRQKATLLVKGAQKRSRFLFTRYWGLLSDVLPQLTVTERSEVFSGMRSAARADVDFYVLISLSSAIATFGLRQSSTAVVIGAMLVAPLMSPILALAHGIVQGHIYMIRRAAVSTTQGVATAVGISALAATLLHEAPPTSEMLARGAPTLLDLGVAVLAGAAAAYGVSRKSVAASLPGVAIAVALVPPLCVAGHSLGASQFSLAAGSFVLFLTNLAGIVLSGALVFVALGFRPSTANRDERLLRGLVFSILALLLLAIPLTWEGRSLRRAETLEASIEDLVERRGSDIVVKDVEVSRSGAGLVVRATVFAPGELDSETLAEVERRLSERIRTPVRIEATVVRAQVLTSGEAGDPDDQAASPDDAP